MASTSTPNSTNRRLMCNSRSVHAGVTIVPSCALRQTDTSSIRTDPCMQLATVIIIHPALSSGRPRVLELASPCGGLAVRAPAECGTPAQPRSAKVTGLVQKLGQFEAVHRDLQSKSWANLRLLGQPCNFYAIVAAGHKVIIMHALYIVIMYRKYTGVRETDFTVHG